MKPEAARALAMLGERSKPLSPVMQAVMLAAPSAALPALPSGAEPPIAAGPGCHLCARTGCPARR